MRKAILPRILITGVLILFTAQFIHAREPETATEQVEYNLILNEVLDRVEESISPRKEDPAPVFMEDDPSADKSIEELPEIKGEELFGESPLSESPEPVKETEFPQKIEYSVEIVEIPDAESAAELETRPEPKQELDPEFTEARETKIIPLWHAEASGIIEALHSMKSPDGEVAYNEEDRTLILVDIPGQLKAMSALVEERDILLETEIFKTEYITGQEMIGYIEKILTENIGEVQFYEKDNSIAVTDTPVKIGKVKELIFRKDRINKQVLIETKILQIILNDEHVTGVDWEAIVSDYQKVSFPGFNKKTGPQGNGQLNLGTVSKEDYTILLEALDTVGVVRTASERVVEVENTEKGLITVYPLPPENPQEEDTALESSENNPADRSRALLQGGEVHLHLTPTVNRDKKIAVFVKPELTGTFSGSSKVTAQEGVVIKVNDGATIVIGSLFEGVMVASTSKIPLLGDLPLLGFVFRNQGEKLRKAEIITFLTVQTVEKDN